MIAYLLDTSVCINLVRARGGAALARLARCETGTVGISAITLAELHHGAHRSRAPERNRVAIAQFCAPLEILPFDRRAASAYGAVRARLEQVGTPIGPLDTLIAAHAVSLGAVLVTGNEREFLRVEGLQVENWGRRR